MVRSPYNNSASQTTLFTSLSTTRSRFSWNSRTLRRCKGKPARYWASCFAARSRALARFCSVRRKTPYLSARFFSSAGPFMWGQAVPFAGRIFLKNHMIPLLLSLQIALISFICLIAKCYCRNSAEISGKAIAENVANLGTDSGTGF